MKFIESETIELKRQVVKTVIHEVIAFANTSGGKIYIGVEDDGTVVGVDDSKKVIEQLASMINDSIEPSLNHYVSLYSVIAEELEVVCVEIQKGKGRPYYVGSRGMKSDGVFVRLGTSCVPATASGIRAMIMENDGITYEAMRSLEQDLTFGYTSLHFKKMELEFGESQKRTLGLVDENGMYSNLGLLLSDQCPHYVKAAIFQDDTKTVFRHRTEFQGSILKQLDDAFQYMEMQNHLQMRLEGLYRVDTYDFDKGALREALINAIVHRDYDLGGQIFINIYKTFIEFISLGSLPAGMTYEDMMGGVSKPRNPKLAEVFYRLKLIEAYGTGIGKILRAYDQSQVEPEFLLTPNAFIVRMPMLQPPPEPKHVLEASPYYGAKSELLKYKRHSASVVRETTADYGTEVTQSSLNLFDNGSVQEDIVNRLRQEGFITRKKLQEVYGFSQTKSGGILSAMESEGLIEKRAKGKNTHYVLRG